MAHNVKLAGKTFDLPHPFPLGLLRRIDPDFQRYLGTGSVADPAERSEKIFELSEKIVVAAISHLTPSFTPVQLNEMQMTNSDLVAAVKSVALASGLYKEPPSGEVKPVETPANP